MLAGASGIDYALLTVAADDGIMPQTREHLAILDLLGVDRGVVAITKADLASPERLAEVERQGRAATETTTLAGAEIMAVSARTGRGVDRLRAHLEAAAAEARRGRSDDARFRLAVDRSFTLTGVGVVATGTVHAGSVRVGDRVEISPSGLLARVRSLHAQNRAAEWAHAGDRCALGLAGPDIAKDAIRRGDVVLDPALHAPTNRIDALLRISPDATVSLVGAVRVEEVDVHHAEHPVVGLGRLEHSSRALEVVAHGLLKVDVPSVVEKLDHAFDV